MSLDNILPFIASKRIWLWSENGILRFSAPKGVMDSGTRKLIKTHRDQLLKCTKRYTPNRCLIAPASSNQSSLIFIQKLDPLSAAYNVAISFRLCEPLKVSVFESVCNLLCHRHPLLRVSFMSLYDETNGKHILCQVIKDPFLADVQYVDLDSDSIETLKQAVIKDYKRNFDYELGPLIRWTIFNASGPSPVVLLTVHHSIVDAWSLKILFKEFLIEYKSNKISEFKSEEKNIPDNIEYIDFTLNQHKLLKKGYYKEHYSFFKSKLQNCIHPIKLPTDLPRPEIVISQGESIPFVVTHDIYMKAISVGKQYGVTINTIMLTAFLITLHDEIEQDRFILGMPVSNRTNGMFQNAVGYFVNTVAMPFCVNEVETIEELIQQVHSTIVESVKYRELPFSCLVDYMNPPRDTSRTPIFQIFFNFLSRSLLGVAGDFLYYGVSNNNPRPVEGVEIMPFPIPQQEGQFDLTLEIIERENHASGQLKYSSSLFLEKRVRNILKNYVEILESLVNKTKVPLVQKIYGKDQEKSIIAIAATFTANNLSESIEFWINRLKLDITTRFTEYGQVMQQLLDPTSVMRTNVNGYNVILLRFDDLCYSGDKSKTFSEIISSRCDEILSSVASCGNLMFFIFFCPPAPALTALPEIQTACNDIQARYTKLFNDIPGVYATGWDTILSWYPVGNYHDQIRLDNGHIPYTDTFFTALSTAIIRRIFVISQKPVKIIATDCDNTLWKGVVAEDGLEGIEINEEYRMFQKLLLQQSAAGKLLAVISKNREEDVNTVFKGNSLMLLTEHSIHSRRINWNRKSDNIRSLADELNLGLESFLFIDDNPVEFAEVTSTLPQVITLKFPGTSQEIPAFLNGLWMLDYPKMTKEDRRRSEYYHIEKQRNVIREQTRSLTEFLEKLELELTFEELNQSNGERLSQLTYRTNQFNFTGIKYSYHQLRQLQESGYYIYAVFVKDRFGDYGNVGMVICRSEDTNMTVETFLLSCRVLGRGVEYQILQMLEETCSRMNIPQLQLQYTRTDRNQPALDFIDNIVRQCPSSKRENGAVIIPVNELPQISAVSNKNSSSHIMEQTLRSDLPTEIADQSSFDIMERNRCYIDIVENLSSIDKISKELQLFMNCKYNRTDISGKLKPAASPLEKKIAEIWKKILHVKEVDTYTNFFDTGGTSLQLPQVLADLETSFNVKLMLVDLFKYTTIHTQAEFIQNIITPVKKQKTIKSDSVNKRLTGIQAMRQRQQQSRSRLNTQ